MRALFIAESERPRYAERLAALERLATYPLGGDTFRIDHGPDYFAFFDRMGESRHMVALEGDELVAVGGGVRRRIPLRDGARPTEVWYGCDMKVHPAHRGRRIPLKMTSRALFKALPDYFRTPRGYAITMNPGDGAPNPVVKLSKHFFIKTVATTQLGVWSFDAETMARMAEVVVRHRGPISYLSLRGIKDIVLGSTGAPMPLLHVQFGPCAERGIDAPLDGHTHMLCAPLGDALANELAAHGHAPGATATVISKGMDDCDFRFVLTSEI